VFFVFFVSFQAIALFVTTAFSVHYHLELSVGKDALLSLLLLFYKWFGTKIQRRRGKNLKSL